MRRVMIIGNAGSGKSTLARALGARLSLNVLHMDTIFWKSGWVESSVDELRGKLETFLHTHDTWVIDGNYSRTWPLRLERADTVIFLDAPVWVSLYRVVKRRVQYHGRSRPDLTEGCPEKIDLEFLQWILGAPKRRPGMITLLEQANAPSTCVRPTRCAGF
jgi:adenylate kinase family enzyme